jgi:hypothetical protein
MVESTEKQCKWGSVIDLRAIEEETMAEAREWARERMEEKLLEKVAAFSPGGDEKAPRCPTPGVDAKNDGGRRRTSERLRPGPRKW